MAQGWRTCFLQSQVAFWICELLTTRNNSRSVSDESKYRPVLRVFGTIPRIRILDGPSDILILLRRLSTFDWHSTEGLPTCLPNNSWQSTLQVIKLLRTTGQSRRRPNSASTFVHLRSIINKFELLSFTDEKNLESVTPFGRLIFSSENGGKACRGSWSRGRINSKVHYRDSPVFSCELFLGSQMDTLLS